MDIDDLFSPNSYQGILQFHRNAGIDVNFSQNPEATASADDDAAAPPSSSMPNGSDNGNDCALMQAPYDGQTFGSFQELVQYLQAYANAVGFQWRTRSSRKDKNGETCGVRMVCSKEGVFKPRGRNIKCRTSRREGCDVAMSSTLQEHGQWKINKVNVWHCHGVNEVYMPHCHENYRPAVEEKEVGEEEEEEEGENFPNGMKRPYFGQTFGGLPEMIEFLQSYAKAIGFQWRTRSSRKVNNSSKVCGIRLVCSKEGSGDPGSRSNPHGVGCDVSLTSTLQKDGQWKINKIRLQHCHDCDQTATRVLQRRYLLPLNDIGEEQQENENEVAGHSSSPDVIDCPSTDPPSDGQTFGGLNELLLYLRCYARGVGFEWRIRSSRKDEKSGEACAVRIVCHREGKKAALEPSTREGPSIREGCPVAISTTLQKDGQWKINKINLQHSHELNPNMTLTSFRRRRYRSFPHMQHPSVLNDGSAIENEEEGDKEEVETEAPEEQPEASSADEDALPSLNDAIMEEQPSFEAPFSYQGAIDERNTTGQQIHGLAVFIEQKWKKLKRDMDIFLESNSDNVNELSNMESTVDFLIYHYVGDDAKTQTLQDVRQLLTEVKDKVSCLISSKNIVQSELENLYKENPNIPATMDREKLALRAEESKLSQLTCEEAVINAEIEQLMAKKQSVLSQKALVAKNVEKGKQKMAELKNTQEKIKQAENSFFKWRNEMYNIRSTMMRAKGVVSKLNA